MKEFTFKINGAEYKCAVEEIEAGKTNVTVNGKVYEVETEAPKEHSEYSVAEYSEFSLLSGLWES